MNKNHDSENKPDHSAIQLNQEASGSTVTISVMLAVADTPAAADWYKKALGATELWSFGPVAGLQIAGATFFLGEPAGNGWECPGKLGITSARVEVFCDDPDNFIAHAVKHGANGSADRINPPGEGAFREEKVGRAGLDGFFSLVNPVAITRHNDKINEKNGVIQGL